MTLAQALAPHITPMTLAEILSLPITAMTPSPKLHLRLAPTQRPGQPAADGAGAGCGCGQVGRPFGHRHAGAQGERTAVALPAGLCSRLVAQQALLTCDRAVCISTRGSALPHSSKRLQARCTAGLGGWGGARCGAAPQVTNGCRAGWLVWPARHRVRAGTARMASVTAPALPALGAAADWLLRSLPPTTGAPRARRAPSPCACASCPLVKTAPSPRRPPGSAWVAPSSARPRPPSCPRPGARCRWAVVAGFMGGDAGAVGCLHGVFVQGCCRAGCSMADDCTLLQPLYNCPMGASPLSGQLPRHAVAAEKRAECGSGCHV